jgi:hypothetical protein
MVSAGLPDGNLNRIQKERARGENIARFCFFNRGVERIIGVVYLVFLPESSTIDSLFNGLGGLGAMKYHDGSTISLGDTVTVSAPGGTARGRVVMLGDSYEHLDIDEQFLRWVKLEKVLDSSFIVIEWVDTNPFAHDDPRYATIGNYMFVQADEELGRAK